MWSSEYIYNMVDRTDRQTNRQMERKIVRKTETETQPDEKKEYNARRQMGEKSWLVSNKIRVQSGGEKMGVKSWLD